MANECAILAEQGKRQIDPQLFSETAETLAKKSTRNGWDHGTN